MKVFIIDPGYRTKDALSAFRRGDFPGHALYGVQYFQENGIRPVWQEAAPPPENGFFPRLRAELLLSLELLKRRKEYGAVFAPFSYFCLLPCILKFLGILPCPFLGLFHGVKGNGLRGLPDRLRLAAFDRPVFITEGVYEKALSLYPRIRKKAVLLPLAPEVIPYCAPGVDAAEVPRFDFVSAGKTFRDFETLFLAIRDSGLTGFVAGCPPAGRKMPGITVRERAGYRELSSVCRSAGIAVVPLLEAGGIFGLTSVLDAFSFGLPLVLTRTLLMPLDPEKLGIGLTVPPGDPEALREAMERLLGDRALYGSCRENIRSYCRSHSQRLFSGELCRMIREISECPGTRS